MSVYRIKVGPGHVVRWRADVYRPGRDTTRTFFIAFTRAGAIRQAKRWIKKDARKKERQTEWLEVEA